MEHSPFTRVSSNIQPHQTITSSILDKYIHQQTPILDSLQTCIYNVIPYWSISMQRISRNICGIIQGQWQFDFIQDDNTIMVYDKQGLSSSVFREINDDSLKSKNISIYLGFWLPFTTMLLSHILHNQPNVETKFNVFVTGAIMLISMIILSFALYVYSNVLNSPYPMYLQHFCPTSYINIITFFYVIISAASPSALLVPMTIFYPIITTFLHFRIYNNALKPTLLELIILFLIIGIAHCSSAYAYYATFSWIDQSSSTIVDQQHSSNLTLRHFFYNQPRI